MGKAVNLAEKNDQNSEDFEELLASHQGRLFGFIRSLLGSSQEAEDILQNTNRVLWENTHRYTPGTNFRAWAFKVAKFQVMHHRDRMKRAQKKVVNFSDEII